MAHMRSQRDLLFGGFYWWRTQPERYTVQVIVHVDAVNPDQAGEACRDALAHINPDREVAIDKIDVDMLTHEGGEEFEAKVLLHVSLISMGFDEAASFVYSSLNPWSQISPVVMAVSLEDRIKDLDLNFPLDD